MKPSAKLFLKLKTSCVRLTRSLSGSALSKAASAAWMLFCVYGNTMAESEIALICGMSLVSCYRRWYSSALNCYCRNWKACCSLACSVSATARAGSRRKYTVAVVDDAVVGFLEETLGLGLAWSLEDDEVSVIYCCCEEELYTKTLLVREPM